ncbi:uncharacterized protein LOC142327907 [Lycorma delicatula]|uniref:uncharacterized protein LOC142327907 n=1 Tax=Lycorma delicatula TaxID=130591 RepID=UPI003F50E262
MLSIFPLPKQVELHFFRDMCQVLSIFVHCVSKKYAIFKDPRSEIAHLDIISLTNITNFLVKVVKRFETYINTTYPAQPDHTLDDYRNLILKPFFLAIDVIIENKNEILRKPATKTDVKVIQELYRISKNLIDIFGKLHKIIGRKLVPGSMEPVIVKTKYVFFHAQKDFPMFLANSTIPNIINIPHEFQITQDDVRMIIPETLNAAIAESKTNHVLSIIAFSKDPFRWNPYELIMDSVIINVFFHKEEIDKYRYNLTSYRDLKQEFHLRFTLGKPELIVLSSVFAPPHTASLRVKDESINVFIFQCKDSIFEVKILEIPDNEYVRLIFLKDIFPDYHMHKKYVKVDTKTSFVVDIKNITNDTICYLGVLYVNVVKSQFVCTCKHLSAFAAGITPIEASRRNTVENNQSLNEYEDYFGTFILLLILLLFCCILAIIAFMRDRKDKLLDRAIFLEDNYPGYRHPYLIGVFTGNRIGAGTTATIGFQLFGEKGESKPHILKCSYRRVLTRGSDDWFVLFTPKCLGCVDYLYVWSDFHGKCPSW